MNKKTMPSVLREDDLPYEKCSRSGPGILTDTELLAVLLRSGTKDCSVMELASKLMEACPFKNGLSGLFHLSYEELRSIHGIGQVKAIQLQCIAELSRRIAQTTAKDKLSFSHPSTIAEYYMERLRHEEQELVLCITLDTKNHFLGDFILTKGTVNQSLLSPRELFLKALSFHAVYLILIHNHPSGDADPSPDDIAITRRVRMAGELLDIKLLDHIIIGDGCYTSLLESQLFPE